MQLKNLRNHQRYSYLLLLQPNYQKKQQKYQNLA
nr:MAG TPA: hypothetical protein [Caudoviricetes sp.]